MNSRKNYNLKLIVAISLGAVLWSGCTSVPVKVEARQPSFDGKEQNSGFVSFTDDGGALITSHARERYNALVGIYGKRFVPGLGPDDGISLVGDVWRIDAEHLAKFSTMNRWRHEGK